MTNLTLSAIHSVDAEARVLDIDLAAALGFDRPRVIRELIARNLPEIETYGVCRPVRQTSGELGGRPAQAFYLTEPQALLVCMFARTSNAAAVRRQVIEVFQAWRAARASGGAGAPQPKLTSDDIQFVDTAPRVQDLRLAEALGFDRVRDIRKLISRNRAELERCNPLSAIRKPFGNTGGRPALEYWLTEDQALALCALSHMRGAAKVHDDLRVAFGAWRRHDAPRRAEAPAWSVRVTDFGSEGQMRLEIVAHAAQTLALMRQAVGTLRAKALP